MDHVLHPDRRRDRARPPLAGQPGNACRVCGLDDGLQPTHERYQRADGHVALDGLAGSSWGQTDLPADATAIFPPDQVPALPTSDYTRASVHYLNRDGYEVNDLEPGSELSTTERDRYGNIIRELGAQNRSLALSYTPSSGRAARSRELDTQRTYQDNGLNLTNEVGPFHTVRLDSGEVVTCTSPYRDALRRDQARGRTTSYHLPTTQIVAAQASGTDRDQRTTTTDYDWSLRKPSKIVKGAQAGGPALTETMQYDGTTGLMMATSAAEVAQQRCAEYDEVLVLHGGSPGVAATRSGTCCCARRLQGLSRVAHNQRCRPRTISTTALVR